MRQVTAPDGIAGRTCSHVVRAWSGHIPTASPGAHQPGRAAGRAGEPRATAERRRPAVPSARRGLRVVKRAAANASLRAGGRQAGTTGQVAAPGKFPHPVDGGFRAPGRGAAVHQGPLPHARRPRLPGPVAHRSPGRERHVRPDRVPHPQRDVLRRPLLSRPAGGHQHRDQNARLPREHRRLQARPASFAGACLPAAPTCRSCSPASGSCPGTDRPTVIQLSADCHATVTPLRERRDGVVWSRRARPRHRAEGRP